MRLDTENRFYRYPLHIKGPEDYKGIIYDRGVVTRIIINRPEFMNALSHPVWAEIEDAIDRAGDDKDCNVIVISGKGKCFSAGDDVMGMSPEGAPMLTDRRPVEQLIKDFGSEDEVWHQYNIEHDHLITWLPTNKLFNTPKPTIAMVHGYCVYGAWGLAQAQDVVFASEDALFLYPGGCDTTYDIGRHKTMELIMEHRFLTAREAQEYHFVNRVFPDLDTLERETMAFAYRVAFESPTRIKRMKQYFLSLMDYQGFTSMVEAVRVPFQQTWRDFAIDGRIRYEGAGIGRIPVAYNNLRAKLESEGKEVPEHVKQAIARSAQRNDRQKWQKALHQEWRDDKRTARNDAQAKAYDEWKKAFEDKVAAEKERRGIK